MKFSVTPGPDWGLSFSLGTRYALLDFGPWLFVLKW